MNLDIIIEKVDDSVIIPIGDDDSTLQMRNDGVYLNGNLHLWEEILWIQITNREAIRKLKEKL